MCYLDYQEVYPDTKEKPGYWVGITDNVGDILTYKILTDHTQQVLHRSVVRPCDPAHPNHRIQFNPMNNPAVANTTPLAPLPALQFYSTPTRVEPTISRQRKRTPGVTIPTSRGAITCESPIRTAQETGEVREQETWEVLHTEQEVEAEQEIPKVMHESPKHTVQETGEIREQEKGEVAHVEQKIPNIRKSIRKRMPNPHYIMTAVNCPQDEKKK